MTNKNKNKVILVGLLVSLYFFNSAHATGTTVGDIAGALLNPLRNVGFLYVIFSYVAGLILGIMAALKLKEYSDTKGQSKFSTCVLYMVGSTLLLFLPSTLSVGKQIMGVEDAPGIKEAVGDGKSDTSGGSGQY